MLIFIDVELKIASLDEVVIEAESFQEQLNSTEMSVSRITMAEAKVLPALFGEVDIIKTLQLKPGVSSGSHVCAAAHWYGFFEWPGGQGRPSTAR